VATADFTMCSNGERRCARTAAMTFISTTLREGTTVHPRFSSASPESVGLFT
jgi:hypothetical protein